MAEEVRNEKGQVKEHGDQVALKGTHSDFHPPTLLDSEKKPADVVDVLTQGTTKELLTELLASESKDCGDGGVESVFIQNQPDPGGATYL